MKQKEEQNVEEVEEMENGRNAATEAATRG